MPNQTPSPLCFILMPFGIKQTSTGQSIDFNAVYEQIIKPAVIAAGLEPLRADEEKYGGVIHKAMFERLLLCDYAVADLTSANANVFYELGVRHAQRPASTALIFAEGHGALPFDVNNLRGLPYQLDNQGLPKQPEIDKAALTKLLENQRKNKAEDITDSPLYQLLQDYPDIQHLKTETFRDQAHYSERVKNELAQARTLAKRSDKQPDAITEIDRIKTELGTLTDAEPGILVDILLSYRACSAWAKMVNLVEQLPRELQQTVLVQEQYGLALNRNKQSDQAQKVLEALIRQYGPSPETQGILGRVYKDLWQEAIKADQKHKALGYLDKAIETYMVGFDADWRDAYPGVNALTLMAICAGETGEEDLRAKEYNPVVTFAVQRKIAKGGADYWDHATLLELAVLDNDASTANRQLLKALPLKREIWEGQTTANNLNMICVAREKQSLEVDWIKEIIQALLDD